MPLSQDEIEQLTQFLDVDTVTHQADLAFVFGSRFPEPAHIAAELFRQGSVPYILVSGGINRLTGQNEARTHQAILLQAGVPAEHIIVEDESTNTYENVAFALPKIEATLGLANIKAVTVVTKWYHARRALMTLKRHLPCNTRYYAKTYAPEGIPQKDWHLYEASVKRALKERERILYYLSLGHIAEIQRKDGAFV